MKSQLKQIGRYQLSEVSREDSFVVLEGYDTKTPSRPVRVKAFLKDRVAQESISVRIGIEENVLGRTAAYLRSRHCALQFDGRLSADSSAGGELISSTALTTTISQSPASPAVPISDADAPFEYRCSRHVLLIHDKMQSSSRIFLVRDLLPSTVHDVLAHGRLPEEGAFYYFYQLVMAVHFLHLHNVAHRNISTEHMYLAKSGTMVRLGGMSGCLLDKHHDSLGSGVFDDSVVGAHAPLSQSTSQSLPPPQQQQQLSPSQSQPQPAHPQARSSTPQPGSYGICSNCHKDVAIVAEAPDMVSDSSLTSTLVSPVSPNSSTPPLNMLFTTCRHCGVYQSRLQVLQTAVGTPGYLAPETLAYQPPNSLMSTGTQTPTTGASSVTTTSGFGGRITDNQARDIWACGVVLYYMLTASLPFDPLAQGGTVLPPNTTRTPQQVYDMCCRIVALHYQIPPYISPAARQLLEWILKKDTQQRPCALDILHHPALARVRDSVLGI